MQATREIAYAFPAAGNCMCGKSPGPPEQWDLAKLRALSLPNACLCGVISGWVAERGHPADIDLRGAQLPCLLPR